VPITKPERLYLALALAVTLAAYARAPGSGWVWDDRHAIENGRLIGSLANIPEVFAHDSAWNSYRNGLGNAAIDTYRPLPMVTLMLDHSLWGKRPAGFHVTSVLLHLLNVLLVWSIGRQLGLSPRASGWAAALFGVHPAISEAVHWVSARYDVVCLLCFLGALRLWLPLLSGAALSVTRLLAVALLALGAGLSKEAAFLLAPSLFFLGRGHDLSRSRAAALASPWLTGLGLAFVCRLAALQRPAVGEGMGQFLRASSRLPALIWDGFTSLLLPAARLVMNLQRVYGQLSWPHLLGTVAALLILAGAALWRWRRGRGLDAWALGTLVCAMAPVALLVSHPNWSGWGRYLYPVAPAFCLTVAAAVLDELAPRFPLRADRWLGAAAVAMCILCAAQTFAATSIWRSHLSFHLAQIESDATAWEGYYGTSLELNRLGRYEDALPYAEQCRRIAPEQAGCWMVLGNARSALGRTSEAVAALRKSLALDPAQHQARFVLGYIMLKEGLPVEAAHLIVDALAGEPDHEGRWQFVGQAVRGLGPASPFVATLRAAVTSGRYPGIAGRLDSLTR